MVKVKRTNPVAKNRTIITVVGRITFDKEGFAETSQEDADILVKHYGNYEIVGKGSSKPKEKETEDVVEKPETEEEVINDDSNADGEDQQGEGEDSDVDEMEKAINDISKIAELKALAEDAGYPEDEYSSIRSKKDMRAYLIGKL